MEVCNRKSSNTEQIQKQQRNEIMGNTPDNPIIITREQAMDSHVDDILNRQRNLTGERGIKQDHKPSWFLQNWFLFGIAGALAAFVVWAFIEPRFDDLFYIQGEIESVNIFETMPKKLDFGFQNYESEIPAQGWVEIRGQKIWLANSVREYRNGETASLDPAEILEGREVGLYINYFPMTSTEGVAIASYLVLSPSQPAPERALLSLPKLNKQQMISAGMLFPLIAGAVGLAVGAVEGIVCHMLWRAVIAGLVGMIVGLIGGFLSSIPSELLYASMNSLAIKQAAEQGTMVGGFSFFIQIIGRSIAWGLAGMAMGLGQGVALRSGRLLTYGFLGGIIGGLVGGILFDPIDFMIVGMENPSAHWSRMVGFTVIGLSVGVMIGVVQLLTRNAWLRMTKGPLAGKEFLFFKDTMTIGASPKCEIYLFNDPKVSDRHATLRTIGDNFEVESNSSNMPVLVNDRSVRRSKLRHGDRITIGETSFIFQMKRV